MAPPNQIQENYDIKLIYESNGQLGVRGVKPSQLGEFERGFRAHTIHEEGRHAGKFYFNYRGRFEGQCRKIYIRPEMGQKFWEGVYAERFKEIWVREAAAPAATHASRENRRPPPPGPRR